MTNNSDRSKPQDSPSDPPKEAKSQGESRKPTRRRVLLYGGAATAAALVGGLGYWVYWDQLMGPRIPEMRDHRVKLPPTAPKLVVARGEDPARNVAAALSRFGGMGQFVEASDTVLIKPNMGWNSTPAQAANTHPHVVAALVRACRDAGVEEIWVTDVPVHKSEAAFRRSGIQRAAHDAGGKIVFPEESRFIQVPIPGRSGTWPLLELFVKADKIINVPVVKAHSLTGISAGMKNWLGVLGTQRVMLHTDIHDALAGLTAMMKPTLTVVDATRILMRGKPAGGNLADVKQVGAVAVSPDPVAADAWAATAVGVPIEQVGFLKIAEQRQLGSADLKAISPVEIVTG